MSDQPSEPNHRDPALHAAAAEAVEKAEAAATRRRWINLGEFIAVAGLIIAGSSLYLNWTDRRADQADRRVAAVQAERDHARFDIHAVAAANGSALVFQHDERHTIRDATVTFPTALGIGSKDSVADTIDRGWFEHPLLKATSDAPDKKAGRLPVLIALTYWDGETPRTAKGIYDIGWKAETNGPLGVFGRSIKLESLRLHERGGSQERLDTVWAGQTPKPKD